MPLKFLTQPSYTSSMIQYNHQDNRTFSEQALTFRLQHFTIPQCYFLLMPFNAVTSFTEMCGRGYFDVLVRLQKYRPHPLLSSDRHPRMVGIQSYQQQCQRFTLFSD